MKKQNNGGSITLEACMVVPLFIMLMLLVNGFFVMFMGQQIVSHTLIQSTKSLTYDPYSTQRIEGNEDDTLADMFADIFSYLNGEYTSSEPWYDEGDPGEEVEARFLAFLGNDWGKANALLESVGVQGGCSGLDFSGSTVEEGILTVKLKYIQEFPLATADFTAFERELVLKVKLFQYKELEG